MIGRAAAYTPWTAIPVTVHSINTTHEAQTSLPMRRVGPPAGQARRITVGMPTRSTRPTKAAKRIAQNAIPTIALPDAALTLAAKALALAAPLAVPTLKM